MASYTRIQLEEWIKTLKNIKGNVLDIGGSQQSIIKRLNKKELDIDCYKILDLEQPHKMNENVNIAGDLNKFIGSFHFIKYKNFFDIAFCIEVSEYWWNPIQALKNIKYLMKEKGILYLSTHFVYMIHPPKGADMIRYTPDGIEKILEETGFKILEHIPRLAKNKYLTTFYANDKMRGIRDNTNHNIIGSLIKCQII